MTTTRLLGAAAALLVVGVAVWLLGRPSSPPRAPRQVAEAAEAPRSPEAAPRGTEQSHEPAEERERGAHVDRPRADRFREQLRALIADAGPLMAAEVTEDASVEVPEMPALEPGDNGPKALGKYIQGRVREDFFPMAKKCYEDALVAQPKLAGKAILQFTIVGDRKVGGVVEQASLDPKSDLLDPRFAVCLTESMMGVTFDAPPGPKREVTVTYPIEFSPEEPDSGT